MSRGPSPSPVLTQPPFQLPLPNSASSTSLRSQNLRINLENSNHRMRSNTTLSPPLHDQFVHPRSLSQQLSPTEAKDVVLAVRGLRGETESPAKGQHPLREMVVDEEDDERIEFGRERERDRERSIGKEREREKEKDSSMFLTPARARDMRSNTPGSGPGKSSVSTMNRIMRALERSPDEGDTLDLSRKGIDTIGDEEVEMFKQGVGKELKGVWRLALSYNHLQHNSISLSFGSLTRLRYLNLKGNLLTGIPEALTMMANLEILDLSKNNITSFPDEPGRLATLKVLSLTHNGIYSLPTYLTTFDSLKVFKVADNPIEWPPREVLGALMQSETSPEKDPVTGKTRREEDLRPWIENMKSWMRQTHAQSDSLLERSRDEDEAYLASEEEPTSALSPTRGQQTPWAYATPTTTAPSSQQTVKRVARDGGSRSGSPSKQLPFFTRHDSNTTANISDESLHRPADWRHANNHSTSASHHRRTSTSSFTPPTSATTISSSGHSRDPSLTIPQPLPHPSGHGHSRGGSYEPNQRLSGQLTAKKSLPDMRQSHAKIISDRRGESTPAELTRQLGLGMASASPNGPQSPSRAPWNGMMARSVTAGPGSPRGSDSGIRRRSNEFMRRLQGDVQEKRKLQEDPHFDDSKNSYFRRLSMLPASSISKAVPPVLLKFIDAIRGMLFAMSQLHTALRQYLTFALNERVAGVLNRVMEPAGTYMSSLINALDRFDSMSRRNNVPAQAIRGVLEATKESVAVFGKVVAVLKLQSPALKTCDVRYTRTLLLMIFGSMSDIARPWQQMTPLLREIKPLISLNGGGVARAILGGHSMIPTGSFSGRTPISPIPERGESHSPSSVQRGSLSTVTGGSPIVEEVVAGDASLRPGEGDPRLARNRRQGGSFSTHDVEKGMMMGSPGIPKPGDSMPLSHLRHRPSESAHSALSQMGESDMDDDPTIALPPFPIKAISPNGTAATIPFTPTDVPSTQPWSAGPAGSFGQRNGHGFGHKQMSSGGSSHGLSITTAPSAPFRKVSVDIRPPTPASATLFDEDLLDVIETATENAFTAWLRLAEDTGASSPLSTERTHSKSGSQSSFVSNPDSFRNGFMPLGPSKRPSTISAQHHAELLALLSHAEQTTAVLRESLMGLRASPASQHRTTLPDDTQAFIQVVIRVSGLVKAISVNHSFSTAVRASISRLTQSAKDCAILMQVSSLRPTGSGSGPTPLPYSTRGMSPHHRSQLSLTSSGQGGSSDDLTGPASASTPGSAGWGSSGGGLRGLQLPRRQMAMNRDRSGTMGGR